MSLPHCKGATTTWILIKFFFSSINTNFGTKNSKYIHIFGHWICKCHRSHSMKFSFCNMRLFLIRSDFDFERDKNVKNTVTPLAPSSPKAVKRKWFWGKTEFSRDWITATLQALYKGHENVASYTKFVSLESIFYSDDKDLSEISAKEKIQIYTIFFFFFKLVVLSFDCKTPIKILSTTSAK